MKILISKKKFEVFPTAHYHFCKFVNSKGCIAFENQNKKQNKKSNF